MSDFPQAARSYPEEPEVCPQCGAGLVARQIGATTYACGAAYGLANVPNTLDEFWWVQYPMNPCTRSKEVI